MLRLRVSAWVLSLLTAVFVLAADNRPLFHALFEKLPLSTPHGAAYLALIAWLMTGTLFALFLLAGLGRFLKPLLASVLVLSAALAYFTNELGVVFDIDMIRNIADTLHDANSQEALELLSWPLALHIVAFGLLPSAVILAVPLHRRPLTAEMRTRALCLLASVGLTAGLVLPNYKYMTYFSVENRDLRYVITPIFSLLSFAKFVKRQHPPLAADFHVLGDDATQSDHAVRPRVGVMIVGETARADHFSLGGYARRTNPLLEAEKGLMYFEIDSCGTSTAFSVPCMFSMRDREDYSPRAAKQESNVLDILSTAGVRTVWIDNNSSCKSVCNRIENTNLRLDMQAASKWYSDGGYYDGVLLEELDSYLEGSDSDLLIVLHTLGSHGPAYSRRYPGPYGVFRPSCDHKSPKECSDTEVRNAYDNTIVYTDYIVDSVIRRLREHEDRFDSFMLYASDHGESLGENGLYLHGLPYALAPPAQKEVPLIVWLSPPLAGLYRINPVAASTVPTGHLSHDNISHTLLGLFDVETRAYHRDEDIFGDGQMLLSRI